MVFICAILSDSDNSIQVLSSEMQVVFKKLTNVALRLCLVIVCLHGLGREVNKHSQAVLAPPSQLWKIF